MSSYIAPGNVQYNYAQLEGIWLQAGGQPGAAPIAAAIAMAESGGNTTATNQDSNGTVDRGLWQVNSVRGAQSTYDVMGNARAAVAISNNGNNWAPWTTYGSGAYRQYLQANVQPDTSAPINGTNAAANQNTATLTGDTNAQDVFHLHIPGIPDILDPLNWFGTVGGAVTGTSVSIVKFFMQGLIMTILNPMIQIMAGVMGIASGGALVIIGFWIVAHNTETGQAVERGGKTAATTALSFAGPEGKAATTYIGAEGKATTVTQARRPAGKVGGIQYRPARVTTTVQRAQPAPSTGQQLRNESYGYTNQGNGGMGRKLNPTTSSTHKTYRGPGGAGGRGGSSGR